MVDKNTLSHAELNAIKKASKKLDDWRLDDCELYVTTEPCQMCAGAIVQARIKKSLHRLYESKGRLCRFYYESSSGLINLNQSGRNGKRYT